MPNLHFESSKRPLPKHRLSSISIRNNRSFFTLIQVVLATGPFNPPAVRVQIAKTVRFGSKPVQKPDPLHLGGPNPDPYPSTRGFCRVWLDPSVPISSSGIRIILFMVAFRYPIANRKILTLVDRCPFLIYWPPL